MVNPNTTWLITGGCGFIGKQLVQTIRKKYPTSGIRILDNLSVGSKEELYKYEHFSEIGTPNTAPKNGNTELMIGDIRNIAVVENAIKGCNVVIHLAANTGVEPSVKAPLTDCEHNIVGTLNLLEAARKQSCNRFVFASSGAPVGECIPPIHEEMPCHPVSPYGASKLAGEAYCSAYYRTFNLETVCLRFSNVYGPGSTHKSSVVAKFIQQALSGSELEIHGDGTQTRDFIYLTDLVNAIIKATTVANIGGEIFQVATSEETDINSLVNMMLEAMAEKNLRPPLAHAPPRLGDVKKNYSDTSKARQVLGWRPKIKLRKGIEMTLNNALLSNHIG